MELFSQARSGITKAFIRAGISAFVICSMLRFSASVNSQGPSTSAALQPPKQLVASVNRMPCWLVRNAEKFQQLKNQKA